MDRDKAIIEEAKRNFQSRAGRLPLDDELAIEAMSLDRSGWQPTDPDVLAVREILAAHYDGGSSAFVIHSKAIRDGEYDDTREFQAALAAYKKHKGNG